MASGDAGSIRSPLKGRRRTAQILGRRHDAALGPRPRQVDPLTLISSSPRRWYPSTVPPGTGSAAAKKVSARPRGSKSVHLLGEV